MRELLTQVKLFIKRLIPQQLVPKPKKFVYVALGDSTVEGIGATSKERSYPSLVFRAIKQMHKNADLYNLGKAGATIVDVKNEHLKKAISMQPQLVTLSIGANDIRTRIKRKVFEKELSIVIQELALRTEALIVINTIPDFSKTPAVNEMKRHQRTLGRVLLWQFNEIIRQVSKKYNCVLVDFALQNEVFTKYYPEMVAKDGFHPSDFGYALWANTIIAKIQNNILNKRSKVNISFLKSH